MTTPTFTYDPDEEDNRWGPGVAWTHPCTGACGGVSMQHIPVDRPSRWDTLGRSDAPVWTLVSVDPLSISPSLLCEACGTHGFITDGKWVAA